MTTLLATILWVTKVGICGFLRGPKPDKQVIDGWVGATPTLRFKRF